MPDLPGIQATSATNPILQTSICTEQIFSRFLVEIEQSIKMVGGTGIEPVASTV